jgi:cytochrome P450
MIYTESFLQEVFRKASITPIGVIHVALEDKEFHGYLIKKGTYIFNNAYFMHHNKKHWTDPHLFKPERFLNNDETRLASFDALMPFSVGKRICIGENLARSQLFLFITSIFQRFDSKASDDSKFDLEGNFSYIMAPKNFKVIVSERK